MKGIRIVIILSLVALLAACGQSKGEENGPGKAQAKTPANSDAAATISKDEYSQIKNGMSYKEIIEIIGGEGDIVSEAGQEGDSAHVFMVTYEGETSGSSASFVFAGGKLHTKTQMGLK